MSWKHDLVSLIDVDDSVRQKSVDSTDVKVSDVLEKTLATQRVHDSHVISLLVTTNTDSFNLLVTSLSNTSPNHAIYKYWNSVVSIKPNDIFSKTLSQFGQDQETLYKSATK